MSRLTYLPTALLATLLSTTTLAGDLPAGIAPLQLNETALDWKNSRSNIWQAEISLPAGLHTLQLGEEDDRDANPLKPFRKTPLGAESQRWQFDLSKTTKVRFIVREKDGKYSIRMVPVKNKTAQAANDPQSLAQCKPASSGPLTVDVSKQFKDGEQVRDFYSGQLATVQQGKVTLQPAPQSGGLLLLESANTPDADFSWRNATVYFITTDRFFNGNLSNDNSYGRKPDGKEEIGTFHGGDLAGISQKLDYLEQLGINALWLSAPYEQIHGWVGGGKDGDFKHYAYHGYYALDFTKLDANMGTDQELKALVDEAHKRGIRIIFDVVMNHPGYSTLQDMQDFKFGKIRDGLEQYLPETWNDWEPESWESYHDYHNLVDYDHADWLTWWGPDWVRAGIGGYDSGPSVIADPQKGSLSFLPDFKTESTQAVELPEFLRNKADTRAVSREGYTPRDYLVEWLSDWVARYGIDGFRIDTAKHVELEGWQALKDASLKAQQQWQQNTAHTAGKYAPQPFWMVGEVWGQGPERNDYHDNGFDALINFDFQNKALAGSHCLAALEPVYSDYAQRLQKDNSFNLLSYISSHDTKLFSAIAKEDINLQRQAGSALMLLPGAIQLYYGDESARRTGPSGSDPMQGTRSAMNWAELDKPEYQALLRHWQILGQFRERHPAVGAGQHAQLSGAPYSFSRTLGDDRVVVAFAGGLKDSDK